MSYLDDIGEPTRSITTETHVKWAVDCRQKAPIFACILECGDEHEARTLAAKYGDAPVLRREVVITRRISEWQVSV